MKNFRFDIIALVTALIFVANSFLSMIPHNLYYLAGGISLVSGILGFLFETGKSKAVSLISLIIVGVMCLLVFGSVAALSGW